MCRFVSVTFWGCGVHSVRIIAADRNLGGAEARPTFRLMLSARPLTVLRYAPSHRLGVTTNDPILGPNYCHTASRYFQADSPHLADVRPAQKLQACCEDSIQTRSGRFFGRDGIQSVRLQSRDSVVAYKGNIHLFDGGQLGRGELFNRPAISGSQNDCPPVLW